MADNLLPFPAARGPATDRTPAVIAGRLRMRIADILARDLPEVTDDADLRRDLQADSLNVMELLMATEDEFAITLDDIDVADITTVGQLIALAQSRVRA